MNLEAVKYVYLLGAGGIGMSALGRYFLRRGIPVAGYDRTSVSFTDQLQKEGMQLVFDDNAALIPTDMLTPEIKEHVLVIYTPAVPKDNLILNALINKGFKLYKRAEVLGMLSKGHPTLAVAGTHGKTTTSTLVAHILKSASLEPVAFLGGVSVNYGTNYLSGGKDSFLVAEADEYDRSFLQLHPHSSIITSTDADHLDIYGEANKLLESFAQFARQTSEDGVLLVKAGLNLPADILENAVTYHTSSEADVMLDDCKLIGDHYHFNIRIGKYVITNLELGLPGLHNVENAIAAAAICFFNGVSEDEIRKALKSFTGVKRRFEYIIRRDDLIYIDDYAHHPEELRACISSVKAIYPNKKITGVFQPHLFSRTRDFYDGFAASLSMLDEVILLDIYPAREQPIEGVSSSALLEKISHNSKSLVTKAELPELLATLKPEVLLTLGAGDIDALVEPIRERLNVMQR
jgi:UDP-N-acetylmuramate--alanine ligase